VPWHVGETQLWATWGDTQHTQPNSPTHRDSMRCAAATLKSSKVPAWRGSVTEQWPQSSAAHHRCSDRSQQTNSALKRAHHCRCYTPMDCANVGTERTTLPCPHALGRRRCMERHTNSTHSLTAHLHTHVYIAVATDLTDQHATGKGWYIRRHRVTFCLEARGVMLCSELFGRSEWGEASSPRNGTGEQAGT
jgi:hypothetical protein